MNINNIEELESAVREHFKGKYDEMRFEPNADRTALTLTAYDGNYLYFYPFNMSDYIGNHDRLDFKKRMQGVYDDFIVRTKGSGGGA